LFLALLAAALSPGCSKVPDCSESESINMLKERVKDAHLEVLKKAFTEKSNEYGDQAVNDPESLGPVAIDNFSYENVQKVSNKLAGDVAPRAIEVSNIRRVSADAKQSVCRAELALSYGEIDDGSHGEILRGMLLSAFHVGVMSNQIRSYSIDYSTQLTTDKKLYVEFDLDFDNPVAIKSPLNGSDH
jgi:hypothetical protein